MGKQSTPVGLGVVGIGDVAQRTYLRLMQDFGAKFRLAALCDIRLERAEAAAREFGAGACYRDCESLTADPNVEAVLVLTTNDAHYPCSLMALKAGKHVFVEKTPGQTADEVDTLIQEANSRSLVLGCAPAIIMAPVVEMLRETIRSGVLGRICFARSQTRGLGPAGSKVRVTDPMWSYDHTCGPLRDRGVYVLHILADVLGPVRRVSAFEGLSIPEHTVASGPTRGRKIQATAMDNIHMILDFGDSLFATLDTTYCCPASRSADIEISGDQGALTADWHLKNPTLSVYSRETETWEDKKPSPWNLEDGVERFLDSIRTGEPLPYTAEQSRHVVEVIEAVSRSAKQGRAIEIKTTC